MRAANLPYQIIGGTRFFERAEIKDVLAYLRILLNPRSDVDLLRIINVPARGIGQTTVDRLTAWATAEGTSIYRRARARRRDRRPRRRARRRSSSASASSCRRCTKSDDALPPSEIVEHVLAETGYVQMLEKEDSAESDARIENLRELASSMQDYEAEAEAGGRSAEPRRVPRAGHARERRRRARHRARRRAARERPRRA